MTSFPRVALVSIGVGRVQRGFERWAQDLHGVLGDARGVTLWKSLGELGPHERIPPMLWPLTRCARHLPLGSREYHRDCVAYGVAMLPALLRNEFDIIHVVDPPLAKVLVQLRRLFRFRARLLYTDGACTPPGYYPNVDHIHHVSQQAISEGLAAKVPAEQMTLIPSGLHASSYAEGSTRAAARRRFGIPDSTFVILAVSAIKRDHKRVDHIIEEASRLEGDVLLWLDGNPEDESISILARSLMGDRCRITHLPTAELIDLYHLADTMVHAALGEAFGQSIIEALCSGLFVLVHDGPHFEWLTGSREFLVDMSRPGALCGRLREIAANREQFAGIARRHRDTIRCRFDWTELAADYARMYARLAAEGCCTNGLRGGGQ